MHSKSQSPKFLLPGLFTKALSITALAITVLCVTGCGDASNTAPSKASETVKKPVTASQAESPKTSESYEFVSQTRPEDLQKYLTLAKAGYDICAFGAEQLKIEAKPFTQVPADFIVERATYMSNGKSFYVSKEEFSIDQAPMEEGCTTSIAVHKSETRISDGFIYSVDTDGSGRSVHPKSPTILRTTGRTITAITRFQKLLRA